MATKCVHCLKNISDKDFTWDHVLPRSWYPSSFPKDVEKIKAPSCVKCNKHLGKIEEQLRLKLSLTMDPNHQTLKEVFRKAKRSIAPSTTTDPQEKKFRINILSKLLSKEMITISDPDKCDGILPNFGPTYKIPTIAQTGVLIPENELNQFCNKMARGMVYYLLDNQYIDSDYILEIFFIDESAPETIIINSQIANSQHNFNIPEFSVKIKLADDDKKSMLGKIIIWGKLIFYFSVIPNEHRR